MKMPTIELLYLVLGFQRFIATQFAYCPIRDINLILSLNIINSPAYTDIPTNKIGWADKFGKIVGVKIRKRIEIQIATSIISIGIFAFI